MNWFYSYTGYRRGERQLIVPFVLVTTLFFFWAFVHNINGTLIPHLKKALILSDTQSAFIDVAIYIAYFLAAVPAALLGPGEHYALEVSGDSMVEEGILDGDFALIRKVDTARDGEIVVALIDNEEATLKTYRREGRMIRLDPANSRYEPQRYDEARVQIQGRLAGLIRRY